MTNRGIITIRAGSVRFATVEVPQPRVRERIFFGAFVVASYIVPTIDSLLGAPTFENALWGVAFVVGLAGLYAERAAAVRLLGRSLPLIFLLVLAAASTAWSDDPTTTARRAVALIITASLSLAFACRLGLRAFVDTFAIATGVVALASAACIALVPDIGIGPDGAWFGCLTRKNSLGEAMVLGLVTMFCAMEGLQGRPRAVAVAMMFVMSVLLIGSQSETSVVVAALLACGCPLLFWSRARFAANRKALFALAMFVCVGVGMLSIFGQEAALDALGKDATLTGRTDVWQFTMDAIRDRPLLGYGYKVFWLSSGAADPSSLSGTWATQAHNGIIETGLDLGIAGVAILVLFVALALVRAGRAFWEARDRLSGWPLFITIAILVTNFTEATLMKYYDMSWLVFVSAFFLASEASAPRQLAPPTGRNPMSATHPLSILRARS